MDFWYVYAGLYKSAATTSNTLTSLGQIGMFGEAKITTQYTSVHF